MLRDIKMYQSAYRGRFDVFVIGSSEGLHRFVRNCANRTVPHSSIQPRRYRDRVSRGSYVARGFQIHGTRLAGFLVSITPCGNLVRD
jgi:hypothetical protein